MLTHTDGNVTVELIRAGQCQPVAVAVGGGGGDSDSVIFSYNSVRGGGGGSGHVAHTYITATYTNRNPAKFVAFAGGPGQDSYLREVDSGDILLEGRKGGDGEGANGGAGMI